MYLVILVIFRLFRRNSGSLAVSDLLVVVLIADAAQNGMAGEYRSLSEGIVLVGTIVAWSVGLDWLGYHSRFIAWVLHPPPLLLVRDGRIQVRNLRSEFITRNDLLEQLREHGVEGVGQVNQCWLESDGNFSVITFEGQPSSPDGAKRK